MSTATISVQRAFWARPKYLLFALLGAVILYVLRHNESFVVDHSAPVWQHYQPFQWWLLPHGLAGACALFLGPLQFSDRLRRRYAKFHRVAGRFYVAGALIAAPLGFYIQFFQERLGSSRSFSMAALTHGSLWSLTTLIAFALILKGKVQQHRQWMTRSFLVGPGVFLGVRVILGVTGLEAKGPAVIETVVWMCLACAIFSADMVLQAQESLRSRPTVAKAAVVSR